MKNAVIIKINIIILLMSAMVMSIIGCDVGKSAFTDERDGKKYKTVKIGEQIWMAENLNYKAEGSICYDNSENNCQKYGRLYNWLTANSACPSGWHLPKKEEWQKLINFAGGEENAGKKLKVKTGWDESDSGTNDYGFSALPGGMGAPNGEFGSIGSLSTWWASENFSFSAYKLSVFYSNDHIKWDDVDKVRWLHSVRCLQD